MSAEKETFLRVQEGLFHLQKGLASFVQARMLETYGQDWASRASKSDGASNEDALDAYGLLKTMLDNWRVAFEPFFTRKDRHSARTFMSICFDARNRTSHLVTAIEDNDALRYLDAMHQALKLVSAPDSEVSAVKALYSKQRQSGLQSPYAAAPSDSASTAYEAKSGIYPQPGNSEPLSQDGIYFPAISATGADILVRIECTVDPNEAAAPAAPPILEHRFLSTIKRYRELNERRPKDSFPLTTFDTDPSETSFNLLGDSFQLALIIADRFARHRTPHNRPLIATGCLPRNDGSVGEVELFERKLDLVLNQAPEGTLFIFPRRNLTESVSDKVSRLRTEKSIEVRAIDQLDEVAPLASRPQTQGSGNNNPSGARKGALYNHLLPSAAVAAALLFLIPVTYRLVLGQSGSKLDANRSNPQEQTLILADDQDWIAAKGANAVEAIQTYIRLHPSGRHELEARAAISSFDAEDATWRASHLSRSIPALDAYLRQYPNGRHAEEARSDIAAAEKETAAWVRANQTNQMSGYQEYLTNFEEGRHAEDARAAISRLRQEDQDWEVARTRNTSFALREFLRLHQNGQHAERAKQAIEALVRDEDDWLAADKSGTRSSYQRYIDNYPKGRHVKEAEDRIRAWATRSPKPEAEANTLQAAVGVSKADIIRCVGARSTYQIERDYSLQSPQTSAFGSLLVRLHSSEVSLRDILQRCASSNSN